MGIFDRFMGGSQQAKQPESWGRAAGTTDDQAVERYRYMLRTASPEAIEQTHAKAFAKLTPEQRRQVLNELSAELPEAERSTVLRAGETPAALARAATRAEIRQPGTMERTFGRVGGGAGLGGMFLSTMAGAVLGTVLAQSLLGNTGSDGGAGTNDASASSDGDSGSYTDAGDSGGDFDAGGGGFDV